MTMGQGHDAEAAAALRAALLRSADPHPGPLPRDEAVALLRRALGALQASVQAAFENGERTGLESARELARLMDGLVAPAPAPAPGGPAPTAEAARL